jgi:hypothetical protein
MIPRSNQKPTRRDIMRDALLHAEFAFVLTLQAGALAWPLIVWLR